eukprot:COSAG01_NODE_5725_length_4073_cov_3.724459_4_plen_112_part_00
MLADGEVKENYMGITLYKHPPLPSSVPRGWHGSFSPQLHTHARAEREREREREREGDGGLHTDILIVDIRCTLSIISRIHSAQLAGELGLRAYGSAVPRLTENTESCPAPI